MRRIHTTFDLLEGHIIVGLLRAADVEAWLFDDAFVRQDWFKSIAYGGYRVMVTDSSVSTALDVLREYKTGEFSVPAEDDACPACGNTNCRDDPQPRRNVFLAVLLSDLPAVGLFVLLGKVAQEQIWFMFAVLVLLNITIPWIAISYFKRRFRCDTCGHRFKTRSLTYPSLARLANESSPAP